MSAEATDPNHIIKVKIDEIDVDGRVRKDLGKIEGLAANIKEVGLLNPILVSKRASNNKYPLIAGFRRIKAYQLMGFTEIDSRIIDIESIKKGEFSENVFTKLFTPTETVAIFEKIRETRLNHRPKEGATKKGSNLDPFPRGKSSFVASSIASISPATINKIRKIEKASIDDSDGYAKIMQDLDARKITVEEAYRTVKVRELLKHFSPPPKDDFGVVLLHATWKMRSRNSIEFDNLVIPMSCTQQILSPILKKADFFIRTQDSNLQSSLQLISSLGFKQNGDIIISSVDDHWHLIPTQKGDASSSRKISIQSVFTDVKTDEMQAKLYGIIEAGYSDGSKLEIFGPGNRKGWNQWMPKRKTK